MGGGDGPVCTEIERLRQFADTVPAIVYIYNLLEQRAVYINRAAAHLLGYAAEEIQDYGTTVFQVLLHPDDLTHLQERLADFATAHDSDVFQAEYRMRHAQGQWCWLLSYERVFLRRADGTPWCIVGTAQDITGYKQAEITLHTSAARYQVVTELTSDYVFAMRVAEYGQLELEWVTDTFTEVTGYTVAEIQQQTAWFAIVHPDDQHIVQNMLEKNLAGHEHFSELRIRAKTGEIRWLHVHTRPEWSLHQQRVNAIIGVAQDITPQKQVAAGLRQIQMELEARVQQRTEALIRANVALRHEIARRERVELQLRGREALLASIYHVADVGIAVTDRDGYIVQINPAVCQMCLMSDYELVGLHFTRIFPEHEQARARQHYDGFWDGISESGSEWSILRKDGTTLDVWITTGQFIRQDGQQFMVTAITDITERKRMDQTVRESEARFRMLFEHSPDAIFVYALDGTVLDVNPAACALHKRRRDELIGKNITSDELFAADHRAILTAQSHGEGTCGINCFECYSLRSDGCVVPVEVRTNSIIYGDTSALLVHIRDITERKETEARLRYLAMHDALTGLPNRTLFLNHLSSALVHGSCAVLFLDLDRFKLLNDSMGHLVGDQLLITAAHRLRVSIPSEALIARFGGDEFIILLENMSTVYAAVSVAERIHWALQAPLLLDHQEIVASASIGIALLDHPDTSAQDLLRNANMAMYQAKAKGRAQTVVYDSVMYKRAKERLRTETELRHAIDYEEICVFYQPIVSLSTGRVVGFEALARWQHPKRGLLPPGAFIEVAEDSGLIADLDEWVIHQACQQAAAWNRNQQSETPLIISVNVSAREFLRPGLVDHVSDVLNESKLPPHCLKLEITETVAMDYAESTIATLQRLRSLGVQVSLDDFGTGYSSLRYLQRFPIQTLKIDASFVITMAEDEGSAAIVQAIITLAHSLGMSVVAEGIETAEQLFQLRAMHCEYGQGYWFSRPVEASVATEMLTTGLLLEL